MCSLLSILSILSIYAQRERQTLEQKRHIARTRMCTTKLEMRKYSISATHAHLELFEHSEKSPIAEQLYTDCCHSVLLNDDHIFRMFLSPIGDETVDVNNRSRGERVQSS